MQPVGKKGDWRVTPTLYQKRGTQIATLSSLSAACLKHSPRTSGNRQPRTKDSSLGKRGRNGGSALLPPLVDGAATGRNFRHFSLLF